ncbi:hypothetical protein KY289_021348 [Solanum tuberosum]|nr:hypothetical protein KY289_021348 [Solanum tuberosum]
MEDQIVRTIKDSIKVMKDTWSKDLAEFRSILHELVGNLPTSKPSTIEFQRFCGKNPELWISQAEQYFDFYEIAENHKLSLALSYLDGAALTWYQWLFQNKQLVDWKHFAAKVLIRFHKRHLKSQEGRLVNLWHVPTVTEYPSPFEAISPGFSEPDILSPCLVHVHPQRSDISNSLLPQNFEKKSEYPTKTNAYKMYDKMLNNCPKVFTLVPLDDQIEMSDEDDIDLDTSEIQQFHGTPQRDMSESSPYHKVGKFHREGIALVYPCVIARQTEKISRGQIAFEMILVFDPGGGTFDVPILEDMDGVLLEIYKAITNLSICNMPLSADKRDLHQLTLKVLINLISILLYWHFPMANPLDGQNREMSNTIAQAQRLNCDVKFAILRDMYAYVHAKWLTAVELVRLGSIATAALTNSGLRSMKSNRWNMKA